MRNGGASGRESMRRSWVAGTDADAALVQGGDIPVDRHVAVRQLEDASAAQRRPKMSRPMRSRMTSLVPP